MEQNFDEINVESFQLDTNTKKSNSPTIAPIIITDNPTKIPTNPPTITPTKLPTKIPTLNPTKMPSKMPLTINPTQQPTIVDNSHRIGDYKYSVISSNHGNWLLCNGSEISRNEYPKLFELIGTVFGSSSSTMFNLPDFRSKVMGSISNSYTMGTNVGSETITLQLNNLPKHKHYLVTADYGTQYFDYSTYSYLGAEAHIVNGKLNSDNFEYQLRATSNSPNIFKSSDYIGSNTVNPILIMQPTLFGGNVFIFGD